MDGVPVAVRINRLPFQRWLHAAELTREWGLPADEVKKVLKAGVRRGTITVKRREATELGTAEPLFMRIRRHPLPGARRPAPPGESSRLNAPSRPIERTVIHYGEMLGGSK